MIKGLALQTFRRQFSFSGIPHMLKAKQVCKCLKNASLLTFDIVRAPNICYCLGQPEVSQRDVTFLFAKGFSGIWIPQQGGRHQRKVKGTDLLTKC